MQNERSERMYHLAEHLADDHDGLPLGSKNDVLMAAKLLERVGELVEAWNACDFDGSPEAARLDTLAAQLHKELKGSDQCE